MGLRNWFAKVLTAGAEPAPGARVQETAVPATNNADDAAGSESVVEDPAGAEMPSEDQTEDQPESQRWWAPEGCDRVEPVVQEKPDLCTEARALENLLVSYFDGHNLSLPPMPHVSERVLKRLRNPKCGLSDIAKDIAEDQVVAAEIVRMANSPLYRGLHKITAILPAVTRLGSGAIRTLMLNQSMRSATFGRKCANQDLAALLWFRSLSCGYIMRGLAKFTGMEPEDAFLIGLLHDIGNVIVLRTLNEQQRVTRFDIDIDSFEYLCFECHREFGELIADAWRLPDSIRALIIDHHEFPEADDAQRTQRLMIIVADTINEMLGFGPVGEYDLLETPAVRELGLAGRPDFLTFLANLPFEIEDVLASFSVEPGKSPPTRDSQDGSRPTADYLARIRESRASAEVALV